MSVGIGIFSLMSQSFQHDCSRLSPAFLWLSEATAARDRGDKGFAYRACPSLQGYLLIEQTEPRIEGYFRQPDQSWRVRDAYGLEAALDLPPIQVTIALGDLHRRTALDTDMRRR